MKLFKCTFYRCMKERKPSSASYNICEKLYTALEGRTFKVGFAGFWPYISWSEAETRLAGVDVMLMDVLEEKMNFNYEIVDPFFNRPVAEIIGKVGN